jgi:acyl-coenzyme A thioesterase PaaI-like protein
MGKTAVSAELNIRLKKAVRVGERLVFKGWIDRENGKIIYTRAEAKDDSGTIIATANAKCFRLKDG